MFKKNFFLFTFIVIFLKSSFTGIAQYENIWIIWNIGQGQWVTHVTSDLCLHYDFGGEAHSFSQIKFKLLHNCRNKENQLLLSHWDLDHYSNLKKMDQNLTKICWQSKPTETPSKKSVYEMLQIPIRPCQKTKFIKIWSPDFSKNLNDSSFVFVDDVFLIPGDSSLKQEKKWISQIHHLEKIKVLILGHHGSRTSTGKDLLNKLKNLKMAIASSRYRKYKHPHLQTIKRIERYHVALLKTEDWGNIILNY